MSVIEIKNVRKRIATLGAIVSKCSRSNKACECGRRVGCRQTWADVRVRSRVAQLHLARKSMHLHGPGVPKIEAWRQHRDIDEVMLATSLVPAGCLSIAPAE